MSKHAFKKARAKHLATQDIRFAPLSLLSNRRSGLVFNLGAWSAWLGTRKLPHALRDQDGRDGVGYPMGADKLSDNPPALTKCQTKCQRWMMPPSACGADCSAHVGTKWCKCCSSWAVAGI